MLISIHTHIHKQACRINVEQGRIVYKTYIRKPIMQPACLLLCAHTRAGIGRIKIVDPVEAYPSCTQMPVVQQQLVDSITCTGLIQSECSSKTQCKFCPDFGCITTVCACGDVRCLVEKRPTDNRQITNIISDNQLAYKTQVLGIGALVNTNANVTFQSVPAVVARRVALVTPTAGHTLESVFRISEASYVYILRDSRGLPEKGGALPDWMVCICVPLFEALDPHE